MGLDGGWKLTMDTFDRREQAAYNTILAKVGTDPSCNIAYGLMRVAFSIDNLREEFRQVCKDGGPLDQAAMMLGNAVESISTSIEIAFPWKPDNDIHE